jgi:hypothetical protein
MKQIHLLLGGMTGTVLDRPTTGGMLKLVELLAPLKVTTWYWGQWPQAWQAIYAAWHATDQLIIIGYSGGGSRGTYLCNALFPAPIALFVAYDPSPAREMHPIRRNVVKAVCYYNERPLMLGLGGGLVTSESPGHHPPAIDVEPIKLQHLRVQYSAQLHAKTVELIKGL